MTAHQAEKLLGGHAAGILTDEERSVLFQAALKDQALFDALADEDALRELLADPVAKAKLLAALDAPVTPKVVPLWRRPAVMGAAASLAISVIGVLAYQRSKEPASFMREQRQEKAIEAAPEAPQARPPAPQEPELAPALKMPAPKPAPPPMPESDRRLRREESPAAIYDAAPSPAPAAIPSKPAEPSRSESADSLASRSDERQKEEKAHAKKSLAKEGQPAANQAVQPSAVAGGVASGYVAEAKTAAAPPPEPMWTLEKGPSQQAKLRVIWKGSGRVAVILQTKGVRQTLTPLSSEQNGEQHQAEYAFPLGEEDALDLYLFAAKADKADASASFHRRIHPTAR